MTKMPNHIRAKMEAGAMDKYMYSFSPISDEAKERYNLKVDCYKAGFHACWQLIQDAGVIEALEFYSKGRHLWAESEPAQGNVCDPIGQTAHKALANLQGSANQEKGD